MKKAAIWLTILPISLGAAAAAQELTGSSVSLGYSGFSQQVATPGGTERLGQFALGYSAEIGITRSFSIQGDIAYHRFSAVSDDAFNLGLHAIYHVNEAASLGLFLGHEDIFGAGLDYYGIEGGFQSGAFTAGGYVSQVDDGFATVDLYGLAADVDLGTGLALGLAFDRLADTGPVSISRIALTTSYAVQDGTTLYAEIGSMELDDGGLLGAGSISESFFGFGIEYTFGAARGATFDRRGLADLIPGL